MYRHLSYLLLIAILNLDVALAIDMSADIRLTYDPAKSAFPSMAIDSQDNIHVVWIDERAPAPGIYYKKIDNKGSTLINDTMIGDLVRVDADTYLYEQPAICVDLNDNINIVFIARNIEGPDLRHIIYYKMKSNGEYITSKLIKADQLLRSPSIASNSDGDVYIAWEGYVDQESETFCARLDKDGTILVTLQLTDDGPATKSGFPRVAVDTSDNVFIIWGSGANMWYYVNGKDLHGIPRIEELIGAKGNYADIAADSTNIHAVWDDTSTSFADIYYTRFNSNGDVVIYPDQIFKTGSEGILYVNLFPEIDTGPTDNVHLVWNHAKLSENASIYYMLLNKLGEKLVPEMKITSNKAEADHPDVAVDSNDCAHIVWVDTRDGNSEIYYKYLCPTSEPPVVIMDFGDAPESYSTLLKDKGARHNITEGVYLGQLIDDEQDGQPTAGADGDDKNNLDDEDGVSFLTPLKIDTTTNIAVTASAAGKLNAWVDFNGDGDWEDAGEQIFTDKDLAAGLNPLSFDVPSDATKGLTYARFRFNTLGGLSFDGLADDGEVEDYPVEIVKVILPKFDFGDAPESYSTLLKDKGARHNITEGVYLGQLIDDEQDGLPTANANGDDKNNLDDEDGVSFVTPLQNNSTAIVKVKVSVAGRLNAWVDFNKDGDWSEQDEQIFQDKVLVPGTNTLTFDVPSDTAIGSTYARFRFNTVGGLSSEGPADDGEVEDYVIKIDHPTPPTPAKSKNNKEMIKVGNKESIAFGYSYAINNIKVVTNSQ